MDFQHSEGARRRLLQTLWILKLESSRKRWASAAECEGWSREAADVNCRLISHWTNNDQIFPTRLQTEWDIFISYFTLHHYHETKPKGHYTVNDSFLSIYKIDFDIEMIEILTKINESISCFEFKKIKLWKFLALTGKVVFPTFPRQLRQIERTSLAPWSSVVSGWPSPPQLSSTKMVRKRCLLSKCPALDRWMVNTPIGQFIFQAIVSTFLVPTLTACSSHCDTIPSSFGFKFNVKCLDGRKGRL